MYKGLLGILLVTCTIGTIALPRKCAIQNTMKFPDPMSPQKYIFCKNGLLVTQECEEGGIFDTQKSDCVATADDSPEDLSANKGSEIINDNKFVCPSNELKDYPFEDNCHKYYQCYDGTYTIQTCLKYFLFDMNTSLCQIFLLATCYNPTTSTTTTKLPPQTTKPPTTEPLHTTPTPQTTSSSQCPPNTVENIPYPGHCHLYYHCDSGLEELKRCHWFQLFDKRKLECRFFLFARC